MRKRIEDISLSIRQISEKARECEDCVNFHIGQPSFDTPEHVKKAAREGLDQKQAYTNYKGIEELRDQIVKEENAKKNMAGRRSITEDNVLVTVGGMGALYSVLTAKVREQDQVLYNDPCWGPYKLMSEVDGNKWVQEKFFNRDRELRDEAREKIKQSDLIFVNSPSNPLGRMFTEEQAKTLGEVSKDYGTFLVSDEVYHRLNYDREHYSPAAYNDESAIIGSVSKNHGMTGWRIGWIVAKQDHIENFGKVNRAMNACPPKISQIAAVEALKNDKHVKEMREEYRKRRDLVEKRLDSIGWSYRNPEGAIYVFPEVGRDSWDFCLEMVEKGVAMVPGESFGPESDQNVRICFGSASEEEINRGFDILEQNI